MKKVLFVGSNKANVHIAKTDEVLHVAPSEPDAAFFAKPAAFTERSPSQRRQEFNRRFPGLPCPKCMIQGDAEADAAYYHRQDDRGK